MKIIPLEQNEEQCLFYLRDFLPKDIIEALEKLRSKKDDETTPTAS